MKLFLFSNNILTLFFSLLCLSEASATTSIKPVQLNTLQLLANSTDVVRGTIVNYSYRNIHDGDPYFGSERPVDGDKLWQLLEVQIRVDAVVYQRHNYTPRIDVGQIARLWVNPNHLQWLDLLNQERIFFLDYMHLSGPEVLLHGYGTHQWPTQEIQDMELEILLKKLPPSKNKTIAS